MLTQPRVRYSRCRALLILPCLHEACDRVQQQDEQSEHTVGLVQPLQDVSTHPQLAHEDRSPRDNERASAVPFALNRCGLRLHVATICGFRALFSMLLMAVAEIEYRSVVEVHNRLRNERGASTSDGPVSLHTSMPELLSARTVLTLITLSGPSVIFGSSNHLAMNGL